MGLDTSYGCWHGAYSAFNRWRNKVAEAAGYHVAQIKYDGDLGWHETVLLDWGHLPEASLQGKWDETPSDPLIVLIAHSDCDGWIYPEQAAPLADRLEELLPLLPDEDGGGHVRHWRDTTRRFIDGLRAAVADGVAVEFA